MLALNKYIDIDNYNKRQFSNCLRKKLYISKGEAEMVELEVSV